MWTIPFIFKSWVKSLWIREKFDTNMAFIEKHKVKRMSVQWATFVDFLFPLVWVYLIPIFSGFWNSLNLLLSLCLPWFFCLVLCISCLLQISSKGFSHEVLQEDFLRLRPHSLGKNTEDRAVVFLGLTKREQMHTMAGLPCSLDSLYEKNYTELWERNWNHPAWGAVLQQPELTHALTKHIEEHEKGSKSQ